MKSVLKIIILLELIIGYGPVFYLLILSLIMSPFMLLSVVTGASIMLAPLLAAILGALGCIGIFQVVIKLLDRDTKIQSPKAISVYLLSGLTALLIGVVYMQAFKFPEAIMFILPLVVSLHFSYLLRDYLFKGRS